MNHGVVVLGCSALCALVACSSTQSVAVSRSEPVQVQSAEPSLSRAPPPPRSDVVASAEPARLRCVASEWTREENHPGKSLLGMIAREPIRARIASVHPAIERCWEQALGRGRTGSARLVVRFMFDREGTVVCAEPMDSINTDATLDACVTDVVARLRFPESFRGGLVTVNYPFNFSVSAP